MNHLDNDKDLRQEILYEFLNQFKEDKYLSQGNTDKAVGAIEKYTQSKLKAFAGEVDSLIGDYEKLEPYPSNSNVNTKKRGVNDYKKSLRQALKAIKEKYQL